MNQELNRDGSSGALHAFGTYLQAYLESLNHQPFTIHYIDGFSGSPNSATRTEGTPGDSQSRAVTGNGALHTSFSELARKSIEMALDLDPPFSRYVFIERDSALAADLEAIKINYFDRSIRIERGDAQQFLMKWVPKVGAMDRALVLLDVFGTHVKWSALEALSETHQADVVLLLPVGPNTEQQSREALQLEGNRALERFFESTTWISEAKLAKTEGLVGAFSLGPGYESWDELLRYLIVKLQTTFAGVLDVPVTLTDKSGVPICRMLFATGQRGGHQDAIRVAHQFASTLKRLGEEV